MKKNIVPLAMALICGFAIQAGAMSFDFSGSDAGGTGSATLNFDGGGSNTLTVDILNTSSLTLDDNSGPNAPGITAIGVEGTDPLPNLLSWSLVAKDVNGQDVTIGSSDGTGTGDWELTVDGNVNGIKVDYIPNTTQAVQGALYNPDCGGDSDCATQLAAIPNYFTTATLVLNFDGAFTPDFSVDDSPIVRMQNVGAGGEGSLKLDGTLSVPEPGSWLLVSCGLVGFIGYGWRRRKASV